MGGLIERDFTAFIKPGGFLGQNQTNSQQIRVEKKGTKRTGVQKLITKSTLEAVGLRAVCSVWGFRALGIHIQM